MLNDGQEHGRQLAITFLDSEVLHGTRDTFAALLIEAADFYMNNLTMSTAFHAVDLFRFGEQVIQKLYNLHVELNNFLKPVSPRFTNKD